MSRKITIDELAQADGQDGRPSWVARDGLVYDVSESKLWRQGRHVRVHQAGENLSRDMAAAPHGAEVFDRVPLVGELVQDAAATPDVVATATPSPDAEPSPLVSWLLEHHPHPMSVHFPIALSLVAAVFVFGGVLLGEATLETAGVINLVCAAAAAPPATLFGYLSWRHNYGGHWTTNFRRKWTLSWVLMALLIVAVSLRLTIAADNDVALWAYRGLTVACAPIVLALGYFGGLVTFPARRSHG